MAAFEAGEGVGDDEADTGQVAFFQGAEELGPERFVLGVPDIDTQYFPVAVSPEPRRDHDRFVGEMLGDGVAVDFQGEQAADNAPVVVLEVDVEHVPAGVERLCGTELCDLRLQRLRFALEPVDQCKEEQQYPVGSGE